MSLKQRLCAASELSYENVTRVKSETADILLLVDSEDQIRAYYNICAHIPVPLDAGGNKFLSLDGRHLLCHTHGALFRRADGFCVAGPCEGESLTPAPITIEDQQIYLDLPDP